jgi:putative ABC transport system substrate-binding protein
MSKFATRRQFVKMLSLVSIAPSILYGNGFSKRQTIPRIGYLNGKSALNLETYFIDELKMLGFIEGKNIHIEQRLVPSNSTNGASMAAELAKMDLSLIVVGALPFALEVREINPKMPMVIATCPGMVSNGFAESLEHPGGIYTGLDELTPGVTSKRLQLLKAAVPGIKNVALLSTTPGIGGHEIQLAEAEKTAKKLGIAVKPYRASTLEELEKALNDLVSDGMDGMLNFYGGLSWGNHKLIVDFAMQNRIPAIYQANVFTNAGGLMAWASDYTQQLRETAHYVEKILKGARPGDLPVKYADKYYLTLNKKAASNIGINFPKELIRKANKIIE